MVHPGFKPQLLKQGLRRSALSAICVKNPGKHDIFQHAQRGDQIKLLEYIAEHLSAQQGQLALAQFFASAENLPARK